MRIFKPLRSVPVTLLWGGLSFSAVGDQLYLVALTWIAAELFGPRAGYLFALQAFVALAAVLGIGRWADRWDHWPSMIGADLSRAAALAVVVAIWLATGGPGVAPLIGAILVLAIGQAVFWPSLQLVLPALVRDANHLPAANGLLDATDRIARLLGPGLVALLAAVLPVVHFLTLDALSFLASAVAVFLISRMRPLPPVARPAAHEPVWAGIVRGVRATGEHALLGYFVAVSSLLNGAFYAALFLGLPLMIGGSNGAGLGVYGAVLLTYGCTNLASTVFFGGRTMPRQPQFQMVAGTIITGIGLILLGLSGLLSAAWIFLGLLSAAALGGIGGPMKDIPMAVLRQTRLAPADMAAAMRVYMAILDAGILLAMLIAPVMIERAGAVPVIIACGVIYLAVGAIGFTLHANWTETEADQSRVSAGIS